MLVFKMALFKAPLILRRIFAQVFFFLCWLEGNELVSVLKHLGKHYRCGRNDFESFCDLVIVLQVKIADPIFGCLWWNGHTWANLGQMYLYDFYKIFRKCLYEYIIWINAKKLGSTCWLRSGRPKGRLPSQWDVFTIRFYSRGIPFPGSHCGANRPSLS